MAGSYTKKLVLTRARTKKLVWAGLFLAFGLILPFFTGQVPIIGSRLLPMHIPVFLCGFVCGWPYGLGLGFVVPLLRSVLFGMPPLLPVAFSMSFELAAYGFLSGFIYSLLPRKNAALYIALVSAMVGGRVIWGMVSVILYGLSGAAFSWQLFLTGAFLNAIPGIVIQIVLIPPVVIALRKARFIDDAC